MGEYSRRFKLGDVRYMTRATIEDDLVEITQTERMDCPKIDYRSVVILPLADFKKMYETLLP